MAEMTEEEVLALPVRSARDVRRKGNTVDELLQEIALCDDEGHCKERWAVYRSYGERFRVYLSLFRANQWSDTADH
ncbi:MAG: hypothetical protein HYY92_02365 [Parcubacteria group bacterium]|nr:hypothetical protein [Parcubacteria group bacterium]